MVIAFHKKEKPLYVSKAYAQNSQNNHGPAED
jgi:hypothetical protein